LWLRLKLLELWIHGIWLWSLKKKNKEYPSNPYFHLIRLSIFIYYYYYFK
jgi:hypothetical protein